MLGQKSCECEWKGEAFQIIPDKIETFLRQECTGFHENFQFPVCPPLDTFMQNQINLMIKVQTSQTVLILY